MDLLPNKSAFVCVYLKKGNMLDVPEEVYNAMKTKFSSFLEEIYHRENNSKPVFTKKDYLKKIAVVKKYPRSSEKNPRYQRNIKVDVDKNGDERLFWRRSKDTLESDYKLLVHMEEIFDIIYENHQANGHCRRARMEKDIHSKYKNITREMILCFLEICFICEEKRPNHLLKTEYQSFDSRFPRCQVNVINMESKQDGPYKYILVYEDYQTKFVQLRPMKTCSIEETVGVLLKIFTTFGAPAIIHSENGRDFASKIIKELANQWREIKMVHGQAQLSPLNQDVMELIKMRLEKNQTSKWSKCLRFIQLVKNKCRHKLLDCTPFEAMFGGSKCRIGLHDSDLPESKLDGIKTEEDLHAFMNEEVTSKVKKEKTRNIDEEDDEDSLQFYETYLQSIKEEINDAEELQQDMISSEEEDNLPLSKIMKLA